MFKTTLCSGSLSKHFTFELPESKKIGIYFSGGVDSSTLLCLIITQILDNNLANEVYTFSVNKPTSDHLYANRLIGIISRHYNFPIVHNSNIFNPNKHGRVDQTIFLKFKLQFPDIEFYSAGNNMAPPEISKFERKLGVTYKENNLYNLPFLNLYKPHIVNLCYQIHAEFTIPYTHSCCLQADGKCRTCYSCLERQWGFDYLGLIDTDTIAL